MINNCDSGNSRLQLECNERKANDEIEGADLQINWFKLM